MSIMPDLSDVCLQMRKHPPCQVSQLPHLEEPLCWICSMNVDLALFLDKLKPWITAQTILVINHHDAMWGRIAGFFEVMTGQVLLS